MRKRDIDPNARMLGIDQAAAYAGMGTRHFRSWANEIGAVRRYNRRLVYDRKVIDAALDALTPGETLTYIDPYDKRRK